MDVKTSNFRRVPALPIYACAQPSSKVCPLAHVVGFKKSCHFRPTLQIFHRISTDSCEFSTNMGVLSFDFALKFYRNKVSSSKFCIFERNFSDKKIFRQFFHSPQFKLGNAPSPFSRVYPFATSRCTCPCRATNRPRGERGGCFFEVGIPLPAFLFPI